MEACGGAHHWARALIAMGHSVQLIAPQFVKPYVKTNKNDAAYAEAICEAMSRPGMRFVPVKSVVQQDIQALHRVRSELVKRKRSINHALSARQELSDACVHVEQRAHMRCRGTQRR